MKRKTDRPREDTGIEVQENESRQSPMLLLSHE